MTKGKGRPQEITDDIRVEILKRISMGESLRSICTDEWLVSRETVRRKLIADEEFRGQYAHAREAQAEHYADQIVEIADQYDTANDIKTPDTVQRARLRIDARKWAASKLAPKKYGDKLALGGADDLPPIKAESRIDYDSLPTEVLEALRNARRSTGDA